MNNSQSGVERNMNDPKIIVALDYANASDALEMADKLSPDLCRLKVGKELFTTAGPQLIEALHKKKYEIFLDLKFHDIPNTVAKAVTAAAKLGVWMVNVHASGGEAMLDASVNALQGFDKKPLLTAVTVLTSLSEIELRAIGVERSLEQQVLSLASLAKQQGLDGVVCSALEAQLLRDSLGEDFCLVTPGIRPKNSAQDDQTRIVTPVEAIQMGSHYLVMGRPIRNSDEPREMLSALNAQITSELK